MNLRTFNRKIKTMIEEWDPLIYWSAFLLLVVSVIAITSASMNVTTTVGSTFSAFIYQIMIVIVGLIAYFAALLLFDADFFRNKVDVFMILGVCLLLYAFYCCLKKEGVNGNYAWIDIGPLTIQPSELYKVLTILCIALSMSEKEYTGITRSWDVLRKPVFYVLLGIFIIVFLQKDNGSAVILTIIAASCFMIPRHKLYKPLKRTIAALCVAALAVYIFLLTEKGQNLLNAIGMTSVAARFKAVTNPSYQDDATREIFYSLLGISKGGLAGVGFGDSVQKFGYLVSSDADYIFAIIVEETGLIGIGVVFILYALLIFRLFYFAKCVKNDTGRTILVGTAVFFSTHLILNVGGVSGFVPLTGVPLLLLSSGGTSVIAAMISLGISQNIISTYKTEKKEERKPL